MKKLLSILMSAMLCASVVLTDVNSINHPNDSEGMENPIIVWDNEDENQRGSDVELCDDSVFPPPGEGA